MTIKTVAPWIITAASVAFAVFSFTRPVAQPEVVMVATPEQAAASHPIVKVSATPSGMDAETMREIVREVMQEERAVGGAADAPAASREPTEEQLLQVDDGIALVDDLIDIREISQEDIMDLRDAVSMMERAEGEAVLSAYFDALNSGEIVVMGAPL